VTAPGISDDKDDIHEMKGENSEIGTDAQSTTPFEKAKVLLVSYAIPGNVFPVTPQDIDKPLRGNPIRNGYNSHLALVNPKNFENIVETIDRDNFTGEFIIEQQSQLLPAFVVYLK